MKATYLPSPNARVRRRTWFYVALDVLLAALVFAPWLTADTPSLLSVILLGVNIAMTGLAIYIDLRPHRIELAYIRFRVWLRRR